MTFSSVAAQYKISRSTDIVEHNIFTKLTSLNLFPLANCPAGSYSSAQNDTCVECPFGTYQPIQGQKDCVSCGKDLTTISNGTLEEAQCIGNRDVGLLSIHCFAF